MLLEHFLEESSRIQNALEHTDELHYGLTLDEVLDHYPSKMKNAPSPCFIHGGYWHSSRSGDFAFVSESLIQQGISVIHINYYLCPKVSLEEIIRQCRSAHSWVFKNSSLLSIDPDQISICEQSVGGHLVAIMLATDWVQEYGLPSDLIKTAYPVNGLFDLSAFPYSWLQPKLKLTLDQIMKPVQFLLNLSADHKFGLWLVMKNLMNSLDNKNHILRIFALWV